MILFFLTRNFLLFINNITNIIAHHIHIIFIKCNNKNLLYQKYLL